MPGLAARPSAIDRAASSGGLEQFDRVAGRILQQDLRAAVAAHYLVAKLSAGGPELRDRGRQILDFDPDAVPATWRGEPAVGHSLAGPTGARSVEQQPKCPKRHLRESRCGVQIELETEKLGVEGDCRVDVGHDVAHARVIHDSPPIHSIRRAARDAGRHVAYDSITIRYRKSKTCCATSSSASSRSMFSTMRHRSRSTAWRSSPSCAATGTSWDLARSTRSSTAWRRRAI